MGTFIEIDLRDDEQKTHAAVPVGRDKLLEALYSVIKSLESARDVLMDELKGLCPTVEDALAMAVLYNAKEGVYVIGAQQNKFINAMKTVVHITDRIFSLKRLRKIVEGGPETAKYVLSIPQIQEIGI